MKLIYIREHGSTAWLYYVDFRTYFGIPGILTNFHENCVGNFRLFETYVTALNAGDNWEAYRLNRF